MNLLDEEPRFPDHFDLLTPADQSEYLELRNQLRNKKK